MLQVLSVHVRSAVGRSPEEVRRRSRHAELLAGGRRAASIMGMSANLQLSDPLPGHVGAAHREWRPARRLSENEDIKSAMYGVLEAHNLKVLNTYDNWYKLIDENTSERGRWTWEGVVFGHPIDYTICDAETFGMADLARVVPAEDLGLPSDHKAVITRFRFRGPRLLRLRRYTKKPIGWRPTGDGNDYRMLTQMVFDPPSELMITQIAVRVQQAAMQAGTAHPQPRRDGWNVAEARLRAVIASATTSEEKRRCATDALWSSRHAIEAEESSTSAHVRPSETWSLGKSSSERAPCFYALFGRPRRADRRSRRFETRAHRYSADLFVAFPQEFLAEDAERAQLLEQEQVDSLTPECTISTERIRAASGSLKQRRMRGADFVVAGIVRETESADWCRAGAFNRRIMNSRDLDAIWGDRGSCVGPLWRHTPTEVVGPDRVQTLTPECHSTGERTLWSRCFFLNLGEYVRCGMFPVPPRLSSGTFVCGVRDRRTAPSLKRNEWGHCTCFIHIDFARAHDSVRHTALLKVLRKRCGPEPLA